MRRLLLIIITLAWSIYTQAQVGLSKPFSLESGNKLYAMMEAMGFIKCFDNAGVITYTMSITIPSAQDYLNISEGNKVSIEFTDGSRKMFPIYSSIKGDVQSGFVGAMPYRFCSNIIDFQPDFEDLTTKTIQRIVVQVDNGEMKVVTPKKKRSLKLPQLIKENMEDAFNKYQKGMENKNYFNEQ